MDTFNNFLDLAVCFNDDDRAIGIYLLPPPVWVLMDFLAGHHVRDTAAVGPFHDAITIRVDLCLSAIDINLPAGGGGERHAVV